MKKGKLKLLDKAAIFITKMVGSMVCALIFAILAFISLPEAIHGGTATLISWICQTFLQLVLLSVIMVGQNIQNQQSEENADRHYKTLLRHEEKIDKILENQDKTI